jgi:hypothetical protein
MTGNFGADSLLERLLGSERADMTHLNDRANVLGLPRAVPRAVSERALRDGFPLGLLRRREEAG